MTQPATRLITLIMLVQNQPNQKASDLAEKLGVSVRTVHRYLAMLDEMGIPVYSERGPYGGFSLVRGYKMPPLVFTPEEAVAVTLGTGLVEEMWGQLYRQASGGALAKLENLLPEEQRGEVAWARGALIATGLNRANLDQLAPSLEKLRGAVRERRTVQLTYRSTSRPEPDSRQVHPYALVFRWGWWYVVGYCLLRQEMRSFRLDRIDALQLTKDTFEIPAGFDIHAYLDEELQSQPQIQVKLHFAAQAAHVALTNRAYWDTVEEQADGALIVTLKTPDLNWAASSALAYGPWVTVLEPDALRAMVADWAREIASLYESTQPTARTVAGNAK
jgi:predicted DNA-binding transcriptional regulator YafY